MVGGIVTFFRLILTEFCVDISKKIKLSNLGKKLVVLVIPKLPKTDGIVSNHIKHQDRLKILGTHFYRLGQYMLRKKSFLSLDNQAVPASDFGCLFETLHGRLTRF
ncbi:hypothetical protein CSKR_202080 [Clonorchis sinensis]|uniref:Uncharacterized protein n=1 Tax=Clonorchis sinensis TaxID=79923 RepID=A0A8T1LUY2_CLOSI|nr:hypothetical protein CSKR_202080 [Clonorchis sinensis]